MAKHIQVSAPGKLMLLGEHAVVYDRPCLVTAVNARFQIQVIEKSTKSIVIEAPEVGINRYQRSLKDFKEIKDLPKGVQFLEAVLQIMYHRFGLTTGLKITTHNGFSSQYGLGSSSAVSVCAVKALSELYKLRLSRKEMFDIAYQAILEVQGVGSGFDVAAAIWGGTLYYRTGGQAIEPITPKNVSLVVGYSGAKADTANIVKQIAVKRAQYEPETEALFDEVTNLVEQAKVALSQQRHAELGRLMNMNQKLLHDLGVSTDKLHAMCVQAILHGAYGAKLSGAGGGDCMIALVPESAIKSVQQGILKAGGEVVPVASGTQGVRIEK